MSHDNSPSELRDHLVFQRNRVIEATAEINRACDTMVELLTEDRLRRQVSHWRLVGLKKALRKFNAKTKCWRR